MRSAKRECLEESLRLLEFFLREGEPVPDDFREELAGAVERGDLEVISASTGGVVVGVLTLSFRLNVSLGGYFASIEDLYVEPEYRGRGVGRAMLGEVERRCRLRGVSYLEVQVEGGSGGAAGFYGACGFGGEEVGVLSRSVDFGGDQNSRTS